MRLVEVSEGATSFLVPENSLEGVPRAGEGVFYNPEMRLNRDLTVLAVRRHVERWGGEVTYLDATAGTGARGVRVAKEAGPNVVLNDRSREAVELVRRNLGHAGLEAEVTRRDANALMSERGFDLIDVDPFGSPAPFLDSAARSVHMHGTLCVTATDTAPLCGAHPSAGRRRYDARPLNGEHEKEVGARLLLGFVARTLARYDRAAAPLLTLYRRHYFRLFLEAERGAGRSDASLENVGYLLHCPSCRRDEFARDVFNDETCGCGENRIYAGPLWTGDIHDAEFLDDLKRIGGETRAPCPGEVEGLLDLTRREAGGPPLYRDFHLTASRAGASPPPMRDFLDELQGRGYVATRTHFDPEAVKTDAPPSVYEEVMAEMSR
ncbi:MAG: tRNA (guanine(26)-N(2))-dimethyltransferase [Methanonatronarchaeales archaeon]|nr:tRNA (guanine(26)-N(2))-dimethyltransferase [Methanonatronarchaeales archaeon]